LTRPFISSRAVAAVALLAALAGCELFKHNQDAQLIINARVVGMPAGDFFDRYGRPRSRSEIAEGGMTYDWISSVPYARPGPEGLDERVCKLRLTADARGRISTVQIQYDAQGVKSTSRCGEIFAAG
jgi:hypothetical protein